jgi:oxepin-CoA hydrolase/3-oxo-5,6-dehydrosuberyl-CoA semialdehyde dehydrogenase
MSILLRSYLSGQWQEGASPRSPLFNPSTEEVVAETSTQGLDLGRAVKFAREQGGAALRALTFGQRGELLRKLAKVIGDAREELIGIGIVNAGNTRSDAKFDIDGASATLLFYADLASKLGDVPILQDGEGVPIGRSARLYGQHVLVPRRGVAVHINAFNFPAWGMAEKMAASLLAGVPVISKPATATAWMAQRIAELWVEAKVLPTGAFSLLCGSPRELLEHLGPQDVVAFTGSGDTALELRRHETITRQNVHLNVEADSLNAAVAGPDVGAGSETLNLFLTDVVREMTQKAGQKCTAIRRIYAHAERIDEIRDMLVERLSEVRVGNPSDEKTTMGPVATASQLKDVRAGIDRLTSRSEICLGGSKPVQGLGAPVGKGYFVSPTLLVRRQPQTEDVANQLEVFGPVAVLMPYDDVQRLGELIAAGGGGLVSSVYSDDRGFVRNLVQDLAPFHGRLTLSSEKVAGQTVPPGMVLPQLLHGGPGRAGGGEELGGLRGLNLYLQRVALQGDRALIEQMLTNPSPARS